MKRLFKSIVIIIVLLMLISCDENVTINEINNNKNVENVNKEIQNNNMDEILNDWSYDYDIELDDDKTLIIHYKLMNANGNTIREFTEQPEFDEAWYNMYSENGGEIIEIIDVNFDGYKDIITQNYGANVNQYYNIRVWNNETLEFELNHDFMNLPNLYVNEEKEEILTVNYDRGLGNYGLYKIIDNKLEVKAEIKVEIDSSGVILYKQIIDSFIENIEAKEDLDSIWDGYRIFIEK